MAIQTDEWTDGQTGGHRQTDGSTRGRTDILAVRLTEGQTDSLTDYQNERRHLIP